MRAVAIDLATLGLRNVGRLRRPSSCRPKQWSSDLAQMRRCRRRDELRNRSPRGTVRRARHGDLGVAAHDDGVGVMAGVAPAPGCRLAQHHEARRSHRRTLFIQRVLEGGAVAAFVPAGVARRTVEHAVDGEGTARPTRCPRSSMPAAADGRARRTRSGCRGWPARPCAASVPSAACAGSASDTSRRPQGPALPPVGLVSGQAVVASRI